MTEPTATGRPDRAAPPKRSRAALVIPAALAVGWCGLLATHLFPPYPSDQLNYMTAAARFPGPLTGSTEFQQTTRFGLLAPVRLAIAVFGYSEAAYHAVPLAAALLLLLGTYALGTLSFSRAVGVAGAVTVMASTAVFQDSSQLLPDEFAAGLLTVAVVLAVAVRRGRLTPRRWILVTLGLVLGWSYLVREFAVFVWPLVPALIYRRVGWSGLAWLAAPITALVAGETLLCWALYDDPFTRVKAIIGHGQGYSAPQIARSFRGKPRYVYILRLPATLNDTPDGVLLVGLLGIGLVATLAWPRRLAVPIAWYALLWLPLTLFGGVLDPSRPRLRLQLIRYWLPVFPAFVLAGLGAVWLAVTWLAGRPSRASRGAAAVRAVPAVVVLAVAGLVAATGAHTWGDDPRARTGSLDSLRNWLARHDHGAPVWADDRTDGLLAVYRHGPFGGRVWDGPIRTATAGGSRPAPGDLIVLFDAERGRVCGACGTAARRDWGDRLPLPGWRQVYASADGLARVYTAGADPAAAPPNPSRAPGVASR